jgi:hypothetical protein
MIDPVPMRRDQANAADRTCSNGTCGSLCQSRPASAEQAHMRPHNVLRVRRKPFEILAEFIDLGEELASMNALRSDTRMGGPSDAFQAGRGDGARRIGQTKHRPRNDVDRHEASATPGR